MISYFFDHEAHLRYSQWIVMRWLGIKNYIFYLMEFVGIYKK